jgi:hypothetical protein
MTQAMKVVHNFSARKERITHQQRTHREITLRTIYLFAMEYHGGQWSRGYRLLCMADARMAKMNAVMPGHLSHRWLEDKEFVKGLRRSKFYRSLVSKFGGKV